MVLSSYHGSKQIFQLKCQHQGLMGGSLNRIQKMISGSGRTNRRIMCYTSILLVACFLVVYYFLYKQDVTGALGAALCGPVEETQGVGMLLGGEVEALAIQE
ncbi:BET1L, partial [Cordylochernes scorpioides]